jgi:deazaflavin-dependent oxidoreductase (nitroreductase family)
MFMLIAAAAVVLAVVVLLTGGYRVLKAARTTPAQPAGHPHAGARSHGTLERVALKSIGGTMKLLVRIGIPVGPVMLLTVRGRKTGLPRTNPVDLFRHDGGYWLIATHTAHASWIRNLRAAGEGTLARGRRRLEFTAAEIPADEAGTALMQIAGPRLARPLGGLVLRQTLGLPAYASPRDFTRAAAGHPVFRLTIRDSAGANAAAGRSATLHDRSKSSMPAVTAIIFGALLAVVHVALGAVGTVTRPEWISGLALGLIIAGTGNHLRIFGKR